MATIYRYYDPQVQFNHSLDPHPRDNGFQMHAHEYYEIFYFVSGDAVYLVEGNKYPLEPGSIIIMREAETHRISFLSDTPYERFTLHFSPSLLKDTDPNQLLLQPFHDRLLGQNNLYRPTEFKGEYPLSLLEAMCVSGEDLQEQRLAVLTYFYPLLNLLRNTFVEKKRTAESGSRSTAEMLALYINGHLSEPLSLEHLSKQFFLSTSQLERLFKQATGSSIWDYIMIKRLLAARSMIRAGTPLGKAAQESGFRDYSSFYRAYIRKYGISPKSDLFK